MRLAVRCCSTLRSRRSILLTARGPELREPSASPHDCPARAYRLKAAQAGAAAGGGFASLDPVATPTDFGASGDDGEY